MTRKKEPKSAPGTPAWMVTYGDMVTLLLTFFVLLFSFSSIDAAKWKQLVAAFSGSPSIFSTGEAPPEPPPEGGWAVSPDAPDESEGDIVEEASTWEEIVRQMMDYIARNGLESDMTIEASDFEIIVRVRGDILFASASADLMEDAKPLISRFFTEEIIPQLDQLNTIRIEGHTDNVPIRNEVFADNIQLSQRRSWAVWDYLVNVSPLDNPVFLALDKAMIDCNGRGEYHPIASNDTDEGRARNRRVDFVLVRRIQV